LKDLIAEEEINSAWKTITVNLKMLAKGNLRYY
jgi:hypothetical protein